MNGQMNGQMSGDMNANRGRWPEGTSQAQALVARAVEAAQTETEPPAFAGARVWSAIEARRRVRGWSRIVVPLSAGVAAALVLSLALGRWSSTSPGGGRGAASLAGQEFADGAEPARAAAMRELILEASAALNRGHRVTAGALLRQVGEMRKGG